MADQGMMCEVEMQPEIQECVEIEAIPVDISDTVETIVECGGEPMMSMQGLEGRDIILEAQEEIIDDSGDPLSLYEVPVPDGSDLYVESSPGPSGKRRRPPKGRNVLGRRDNELLLSECHAVEQKPRKWEQKQVQIKTMEGEFSVTMWASGASDGTYVSIVALWRDTGAAADRFRWPNRPQFQTTYTDGCLLPNKSAMTGFTAIFFKWRRR